MLAPWYRPPMTDEECSIAPRSLETQRSVLMADIVSSTSLYERLGDARARELVAAGLEAMAGTVEAQGGRVVKSLGDGILACFEGTAAALAAVEICDRLSALMMQVRVGAHFGPVIDDGGDIFGDTVNTTARLASVARPFEVLLTESLVDRLAPALRERCRRLPSITVKGKQEPVEIYSIVTQVSEHAETFLEAPGDPARRPAGVRLELELDGVRHVLQGPGSLLIGRGPECDLRVDHQRASRAHARVFFRAPDFLLEDSSANGTTVVQEGGARALIYRRETLLLGRGSIYPGATPGSEGARAITFVVD